MSCLRRPPSVPTPHTSFTLFQASPTEPAWSSQTRGRGASALQDPKRSLKASSHPPKQLARQLNQASFQHKAVPVATGHNILAAPRVPWPDLVMPVDPSSFLHQEGSRPPLHLDHLMPGDLPPTCPASLDLNLRSWACRNAWASKGPNAFLSAPKASSKGPVTKLHQFCECPHSPGTQPPTWARKAAVRTPGPP